MKIRQGFVTNSSSSSFVLAFNNSDKWHSYDEFKDQCAFLGYEDFYDLIESLKDSPGGTNKGEALDLLFRYYAADVKDSLVNNKMRELGEQNYTGLDCYFISIAFENTDKFKQQVRELVEQNEDYIKKKEEIENADLVVTGRIWDTSGGTLEWAIRNGFIEDNFRNNHVLTWNVG